MSSWRAYTIGEVAEIFDGPHATPKKTKTGPWFLGIGSLQSGRLNLAESAHVSEDDFATWTRRVTPQHGDLLFSYETRLGDAALMPKGLRACLGRRMGVLRPRAKTVDPRFLLYVYLSEKFQETIRQRAIHGATVDRIPLVELPQWPISLPPLPDQQKIAAILGALDDKLEINRRISRTAEELARLVPEAAAPGRETALRELVVLKRKQVDPQTLDDEFVDHYSLPAFDGDQGPETISPRIIKSSKFTIVRPSVLLSKLNPATPRTWVATPRRAVLAVASTEYLVLEPTDDLSPAEVWAVCQGPRFVAAAKDRATGTSNSHQRVSPQELLNTKVVDPRCLAINSRKKIVDLVETALDVRHQSSVLARLRDTLLPGLMSGAIRVRDAEKIAEDVT